MIIPKHLSSLLGIDYPIIQAPMAGGYVSAELTAAVSNSGGLGSIAAGYFKPEQLREQIQTVRSFTNRPFMVNLFVPNAKPVSRDQMEEFIIKAADLNPEIKINEASTLYNQEAWALSNLDSMVNVVIEEKLK